MKGLRERAHLLRARGRRSGRGAWRGMAWRAQSVRPVERCMQSVSPVEGECNRFALWRGACTRLALWRAHAIGSPCGEAHAIGLPCGGRMQSVRPVEGACNRFALWRAHGGGVTHEGIRGAVPPLCVATSRANRTEYWAPSPVCRVNEGERLHGCMCGCGLVGENRALRFARVGILWASSTPRRRRGDARRAEPSRRCVTVYMCVWPCWAMRVACWRGRPRLCGEAIASGLLSSINGRAAPSRRRTGATMSVR